MIRSTNPSYLTSTYPHLGETEKLVYEYEANMQPYYGLEMGSHVAPQGPATHSGRITFRTIADPSAHIQMIFVSSIEDPTGSRITLRGITHANPIIAGVPLEFIAENVTIVRPGDKTVPKGSAKFVCKLPWYRRIVQYFRRNNGS